MAGVKLLIFDADGTLRWTTLPGRKYPRAGHEWQLMPGVRERLSAIPWSDRGPWLAIASNQNGVAAGDLSAATTRALLEDMIVAAIGHVPPGARIGMCICPEQGDCSCRKPAPGLLLQHLAHFGVAAEEALYVGDLDIDAEAARRAGVAFRWAPEFLSSSERCW